MSHLGELAALANAVCFTFTAIAFESTGKKVGSLSVGFLRLFIAFSMVGITSYITRGMAFPSDADSHTWTWLLASGFIGFVIGDLFLFEAFIEIGSRVSLLIMSTASPIAAIIGYFAMDERITPVEILGMLLTMVGIGLVILSRNPDEKKVQLNRSAKGILFACIGALGQAVGLICSKMGIGSYNPFAAVITVRRKWPEIINAVKDKSAMLTLILGSISGPFVGVTLALVALKYTATGIVSSISSISPILVIPASMIIFKDKVLPKEIYGAFISIAGVVLLFL